MARSGSKKYDSDKKYTKEELSALLTEELNMTLEAEKTLANLKGEVSGGRSTLFGGKGEYGGTTLEGQKFDKGESAFGKFDLDKARFDAGTSIDDYNAATQSALTDDLTAGELGPDVGDLGDAADPDPGSFEAPSVPGDDGVGYGGAPSGSGGFGGFDTTVKKGGFIEKKTRKSKTKRGKGLALK
tara:strand:- start:52 stop:606 length:555 start_codon:yes stop_codon:yes gene_type:complete